MNIPKRILETYRGRGRAGSIERRVELVVAGLVLVLLVQLLYSGTRLALLSEPDGIPPSLEGIEDMQPVPVEQVTAAQLAEMAARPVFSPSRKRAVAAAGSEAAAKVATASNGDLENVTIVGVFGSGVTAGVIALVEERQQRLLLGEELLGWTLDTVSRDQAELVRGAERALLPLKQREFAGTRAKAPARQASERGGQAAKSSAVRTESNKARQDERNEQVKEKEVENKREEAPAHKLGWGGTADD